MTRESQFQQFLEAFPPSVREYLQTMQKTGGMLSAEHSLVVMESLNISAEILMQRLLPMTKLYCMTMNQPGSENSISRAVLVERPTSISQRAVCELLLQTVSPNVKLEYFEAM